MALVVIHSAGQRYVQCVRCVADLLGARRIQFASLGCLDLIVQRLLDPAQLFRRTADAADFICPLDSLPLDLGRLPLLRGPLKVFLPLWVSNARRLH